MVSNSGNNSNWRCQVSRPQTISTFRRTYAGCDSLRWYQCVSGGLLESTQGLRWYLAQRNSLKIHHLLSLVQNLFIFFTCNEVISTSLNRHSWELFMISFMSGSITLSVWTGKFQWSFTFSFCNTFSSLFVAFIGSLKYLLPVQTLIEMQSYFVLALFFLWIHLGSFSITFLN